jgi:hypothetical protein
MMMITLTKVEIQRENLPGMVCSCSAMQQYNFTAVSDISTFQCAYALDGPVALPHGVLDQCWWLLQPNEGVRSRLLFPRRVRHGAPCFRASRPLWQYSCMGSVSLKLVHSVSLGHGWVCSPGGSLVSGAKWPLLPPPPQCIFHCKKARSQVLPPP